MTLSTSFSSPSLAREQHSWISRDPLGVCTRPASTLLRFTISSGDSSLLLQNVFITALAQITFSFLRPNELALSTRVCPYWSEIIGSEITWKDQCRNQGFPERLPNGISYKQVIKDFYRSMFGKDFYADYIGHVGVIPPIPEHFIVRAYHPDPYGEAGQLIKDSFQLLLDPPKPITIEINANSSTIVDEKGNLIEQASSSSSKDAFQKNGSKKALRVNSTINNIGKIAEKHLKKGIKTGISDRSWENILQQHGDNRSPSGWSFQKKSVVGQGLTYPEQQDLAAKARLEVVSLKARILFNILTQIRSGIGPDTTITARTSTVTLLDGTPLYPYQSLVGWVPSGPSHRLRLTYSPLVDLSTIGAAVGMPLIIKEQRAA